MHSMQGFWRAGWLGAVSRKVAARAIYSPALSFSILERSSPSPRCRDSCQHVNVTVGPAGIRRHTVREHKRMEFRRLGSSGFSVPVLSFGSGTFGGKGEFFQ